MPPSNKNTDTKKKDPLFKQTILNIKNKIVGNYKTSNERNWIFCRSNNISHHDGRIKQPFVALDSSGKIDFAFLPNIIPKEISVKVMDYYEKHTDIQKKTTTIIGTWNRFRKYLFPCASDNNHIRVLAGLCNDFIKSLLQNYSQSTLELLNKIDPALQQFAKFPTLCLNVLDGSNYDIKNKPYKPHRDKLDVGLAVLLYFGSFSGGELVLSDLDNWEDINENDKLHNNKDDGPVTENQVERKLIFPIQGNDVILINGKKYMHQVLKVTEGERIGLVYFTGAEHVPLIHVKHLKKKPKSTKYGYFIKRGKVYHCVIKHNAIPFFSKKPSEKRLAKVLGLRNDRRRLREVKRKQSKKKLLKRKSR